MTGYAGNRTGTPMPFADPNLPTLSDSLVPPVVRGVAEMTTRAYRGEGFAGLIAGWDPKIGLTPSTQEIAQIYDASIAFQLAFRAAAGLNLQDCALGGSQIYRIAEHSARSGAVAPARSRWPRRSDGEHAARFFDQPSECPAGPSLHPAERSAACGDSRSRRRILRPRRRGSDTCWPDFARFMRRGRARR